MPRFFFQLPDWSSPSLVRGTRVLAAVGVAVLLVIALAVLWTFYSTYSPARGFPQERGQSGLSTHNYAVVIDAGSSGSKVQLFHWPPHNGDPAKLLQIESLTDELGAPLMMKTEPGISSFTAVPEKAFESLRPLLDFAQAHLPPAKLHQTSLLVLGTAGMRLLDEEEREMIVGTLQQRISEEYPFHLPQDGVEVISGKMEGVFSWITINYLLGRFAPEYHHHGATSSSGNSTLHTVSTVGSIDMGGASLQMAFEIPQSVDTPSANTVDINLGCGIQDSQHKHRVFITSYLGYGTNEARRRYYKMLAQQHSNRNHNGSQLPLAIVRDPCIPLHMQESMEVGVVTLKLRGLGDFHACRRALTALLKENSTGCSQDSGCQQPSFKRPPVSYDSLPFYGTSEFWYSMRDVLGMGGAYQAASFEKTAKEHCSTLWSVLEDRYHRNLYPYADFYRLKTQCLKSAWMSLILHEEGLGLPEHSTLFTSAAAIEGRSVRWALGALLYHVRFLPLREIQLHQLQGASSSPWVSSGSSLTASSSFLLPLAVVVLVALLLLVCRHRRPRLHGNLSRNTSYLLTSRQVSSASASRRGSLAPVNGRGSLSRVLELGRSQSSNILSSLGLGINTASSAATSR